MDFYDVEVDCMAYCYGGSPKFTVEPYGYGEWAKREDVDVLITEHDRLAAENAEFRKQSDEDMEAFLDMSRISEDYAEQLTQVQTELAAANATLDALRALCGPNKTISNSTCMKMVDLLYPQPKKTTDDER